jgi:hypothetical protein
MCAEGPKPQCVANRKHRRTLGLDGLDLLEVLMHFRTARREEKMDTRPQDVLNLAYGFVD